MSLNTKDFIQVKITNFDRVLKFLDNCGENFQSFILIYNTFIFLYPGYRLKDS